MSQMSFPALVLSRCIRCGSELKPRDNATSLVDFYCSNCHTLSGSLSKNRAFLICPVRNISSPDLDIISRWVSMAQVQGLAIYWPYRDTNQQDPSGLRICKDNRKAIEESDIVFVYWDGLSQGSLFDLGMAFAFRKRIIPLSLPQLTPGKSFQNMVIDWVFQGPG